MSKYRYIDFLLEEMLQEVSSKAGWSLVSNKKSGYRYLVQNPDPTIHKLIKPNLSAKQADDFERRKAGYRKALGQQQLDKARRTEPDSIRAVARTSVPKDIGPETANQAIGSNPKAEKKLATRMAQLAKASATYVKALADLSTKIRKNNPSLSDKEIKAQVKAELKKQGIVEPPEYDLCSVTIPGTNLYCGGNKEIPRDAMPQLKTTAVPGTPAWKKAEEIAKQKGIDPKDVEVNAENAFLDYLENQKINVTRGESMPAVEMKATQNQLDAQKVAGMAWALATNPEAQKPTHPLRQPLIVSSDGYVLDGHHRWAGLVTADVMMGNSGDTDIPVIKVDMGIEDLVAASNKFGDEFGLQRKGMGAAKEGTGKTGKKNESWNRSFASFIQEASSNHPVKLVKFPPTKLPTGGWKEDWGEYVYNGKKWRILPASDVSLRSKKHFDVVGPNGKRAKNLDIYYFEGNPGGVQDLIVQTNGNWPHKDFDAKTWV